MVFGLSRFNPCYTIKFINEHEAKTGTGLILLTCSLPYVRDWVNDHPFKNEPNARLICNLNNGSPITSR